MRPAACVLDQCRHSPDLIGVSRAFVLGAHDLPPKPVLWPTSIAMFTAGAFSSKGSMNFLD